MNKCQLLGDAMGLKLTAENKIAGQTSKPAESIACTAAERLIQSAQSLNGSHPTISSLQTRAAMTWEEILEIANAVCRFCEKEISLR